MGLDSMDVSFFGIVIVRRKLTGENRVRAGFISTEKIVVSFLKVIENLWSIFEKNFLKR